MISELTRREKEVLGWLAEGYGTRETCAVMSISQRTYHNYFSSIAAKLGVSGKINIVREAALRGIVDLGEKEENDGSSWIEYSTTVNRTDELMIWPAYNVTDFDDYENIENPRTLSIDLDLLYQLLERLVSEGKLKQKHIVNNIFELTGE